MPSQLQLNGFINSSLFIKCTALLVLSFMTQSLLVAQTRVPGRERVGHVEPERRQENKEKNETQEKK
jgi:hypothetical protein